MYALLGSVLGMVTAILLSLPTNYINLGIYGFNGVLCGIAFTSKKKSSLIYAIISIVISVLIMHGMVTLNIITLTSPFVFATWLTLLIRRTINKKSNPAK